MTKLEIIQETADYYSADTNRRSIYNGKCVYFSPNGNRCAVGRYCKEGKENLLKSHENSGLITICGLGTKILKFHNDDPDFWCDLQDFHDYELNWDSKGLTIEGKNILKEIKDKYKNQQYES